MTSCQEGWASWITYTQMEQKVNNCSTRFKVQQHVHVHLFHSISKKKNLKILYIFLKSQFFICENDLQKLSDIFVTCPHLCKLYLVMVELEQG